MSLSHSLRTAFAFVTLMLSAMPSHGGNQPPFRVCADPDNLPFSNEAGEGFENRIASVIAEDLKMPLEYTYLRERKGFLRMTLNANRCDVVIGVPSGLERVLKTEPYYRSSYMIVSRKDRHLKLDSYDNADWKSLKIGLHTIGDDGANSPPAHVLGHHQLGGNVVGFPMWGTEGAKDEQGRVVRDVADKKIDAAIVWGPFAGYFAKPYGRTLLVEPAPVDKALPGQVMAWDIVMAVRKDDEALKAKLNDSIQRQHKKIQQILKEYNIPTESLPLKGKTPAEER